MRKEEILKRLEELSNSESVLFTMKDGVTRTVRFDAIKNYADIEMIEAPTENFKVLYSSIFSINPNYRL